MVMLMRACLVVLGVVPLACTYPPLGEGAPDDAAMADAAMADAATESVATDAANDGGATADGEELPDATAPSACGAADVRFELPGAVNGLNLAIGAGGDAIIAWSELGRIKVAEYVTTTDRWALTSLDLLSGTFLESLTLAVGRRGDALAVNTNGTLSGARRTASGSWVSFSAARDLVFLRPRAVIDDAGNMLLAWIAASNGSSSVQGQRFVATDERWEPSAPLSGPTTTQAPALAMNGSGDAVVVWRESADPATRLVARRFSASANSWSPPHEIVQAPALSDATATLDSRGGLVVSWNEYRDERRNLRAAVFSVDDGWGAAQDLATDVGHTAPPILIAGPDGNPTALWSQGQSREVWGARWSGSSWSEPTVEIRRDNVAGALEVASDERGNAVAAWPRCDGTTCRVEVARRRASDGIWQPTESIHERSSSLRSLSLAVGASEASALLAWQTADPPAICVARIW
jgi:hypothetical protein